MKKIAVIYSKYSPVIDAIKYTLSDCSVDCLSDTDSTEFYDLVICLDNKKFNKNAIACHHSLLPAFDCDEPEKEAILSGAKVTGITIYNVDTKKIITQYPVFINNDTHYDDLKQELTYLEQTLLPIVAKKIINNEPFEIKNLLNSGCNRTCGGCSSCKH